MGITILNKIHSSFWSLTLSGTVLCFLNNAGVTAQEETVIPRSSGFALGVGVGAAIMYGDLNKHIPQFGERIGLARHLTNSLMIGVEYYGGALSSEESANGWTTGLKSKSTFYSFDVNAKVNLSVLFSNTETPLSQFMSGFYFGSGVGYINVSVTSITEILDSKKPLDTSLRRAIKKHDAQPYLPLNLGYRYPLKNFLGTHQTQLMVNMNMCYTYSDYIDGYNLGLVGKGNKANRFNDVYAMVTFGLSFALTPNPQSAKWHLGSRERRQKFVEDKPKYSEKPTEKKKESIKPPEFKQSIID